MRLRFRLWLAVKARLGGCVDYDVDRRMLCYKMLRMRKLWSGGGYTAGFSLRVEANSFTQGSDDKSIQTFLPLASHIAFPSSQFESFAPRDGALYPVIPVPIQQYNLMCKMDTMARSEHD